MANEFGYDDVLGFKPATGPLVLSWLQAKLIAATSINIDVENGPSADLLDMLGPVFTELWQDQEGVYNSSHIQAAPGTGGVAGGAPLELLLSPRIGSKVAAAFSTVSVTLNADVGPNVNVPAGHAFTIAGETGLWALDAPAVIPGGGSLAGQIAKYFETGPKIAPAGLAWEIVNAVPGWASVGPNLDAIPGRDIETDAEYRERARERNDVVAAVRALPGVTSASLIEWPWGFNDAFWGASHWFEVLAVGGDNDDIAATIHAVTKITGVNTQGNITIAVPDADYVGGSLERRFSRPVNVVCYVDVVVTKGEGYPTDVSTAAKDARVQAVKDAVTAHFASLQPGANTSGFTIGSHVDSTAGIPGIALIVVEVDTITPPVNTGVLVAAVRDQLVIAQVDISVVGV